MVKMVFNFSIMFIALATFVTRDLHSTILLNLWAARQLFAIFTTAMQSCVRSYCIPKCVYFCFSKDHHWRETLLCIFLDDQLVFVRPRKTIIFKVLFSGLFNLYCQLTHYFRVAILSWLSLTNCGINYFLMKLKITNFNCCSFVTTTWWKVIFN